MRVRARSALSDIHWGMAPGPNVYRLARTGLASGLRGQPASREISCFAMDHMAADLHTLA
jgi:hypothetical protein